MRELQQSIVDPQATPAQREAAREALAALLRKPPRAAIDPYPSVVKPLPPETEASSVARLRVVEPSKLPEIPRPTVDPRTGAVLQPGSRIAIDPLSGHVLHEVPGGYVDPTTGRFVPR